MANYEDYFQLLNASRYGVAQKRERVYFVCFRKDLNITTFRFPSPLDKQVSLLENLLPQDDPRLEDLIVRRSDLRLRSPISTEGANKPIRVGTVGKGGQGERVYGVQGHAVTLSAFGGGVGARTGLYLQEDLVRRLHPEECRRLMGFPEGFVCIRGEMYALSNLGIQSSFLWLSRFFKKSKSFTSREARGRLTFKTGFKLCSENLQKILLVAWSGVRSETLVPSIFSKFIFNP